MSLGRDKLVSRDGAPDGLQSAPRRPVEFLEVLGYLRKGSDDGRAVLNILDTVVLSGSGQPDTWYFTSKTGIVMRKSAQSTVISTIVQQFRAIAFRFPTIHACIAHYGTRVEVLSDTEFTTLAKTALPPGLYVLQAYVLPRGGRGKQYANYYHEWELGPAGRVTAGTFKLGAEHLASMQQQQQQQPSRTRAGTGPIGAASVPRDRLIRSRERRINDTLHGMAQVVARCVESARHEKVVAFGAEFVMDQEGSLWFIRTTHLQTVRPRDVERAERRERRRQLHMRPGGGGRSRSPVSDRGGTSPPPADGPHYLQDRLGPKHTPGGAALDLARTDGSDAPGSVGLFGGGGQGGPGEGEGDATAQDAADEMMRRAEGILREEEMERMLAARVCPGDYCEQDLAQIDPVLAAERARGRSQSPTSDARLRDRLRQEVGQETARAASAWQRATASEDSERARSRSRSRARQGEEEAAGVRREDVRHAISFHVIAEARLEKDAVSAYLEELSGGNEDAAYGSHGREHALMLARAFPGYYYRQVKVCDSCYAVYSRIQQAKERADRPRGRGRTRHRRRRRHRGRSGAGSAALSRPPGPGQLRPLTQGPREALARARGSQSLRFRPASLRASARSLPSLSGTGRPVTGASAAVGRGAQWEGDRPGSAFGQGGSEVEGGFDARPPTPSLAGDDQTREALLGVSDGVSDGGEGLPQNVADGLDLAGRAMRLIGKSDVAELRSYASPPPSVSLVAAAVTLLATGEPMPWGAAKKLMANGERFLRLLAAVDKDRVPAARLRALVPILHRRAFQPFALEGRVETLLPASPGSPSWSQEESAYESKDPGGRPDSRAASLTDRWEAQRSALNSRASVATASSLAPPASPLEARPRTGARTHWRRRESAAREMRTAARGEEDEVRCMGRGTASALHRTVGATASGRWRPSRQGDLHQRPGSELSGSLRAAVPGGPSSPGFRPATTHPTAARLRSPGGGEPAGEDGGGADGRGADRRQQAARRRIQDAQMKRLHRSNMGEVGGEGDTSVTATARTFDCADGLTSIPYHVLGQPDIELKAPSFVVIHDLFDTFETMQIMLSDVVKKQYGCQALVFNLPGQALTRFTVGTTPAEARHGASGGEVVLNNVYHADRVHELLQGLERTGEFVSATRPFYLLGVGNGANVATQFALRYGAARAYRSALRSLLLINPFAEVDPQHAAVLHSCVNVFSCFPPDRPDLPVSYFSRFVFSDGYLQRVEPSMALNLYTAVSNPITLSGRIHLLRGALRHVDMRDQLRQLRVPLVVVQSTENALVNPSSLDPYLDGRRVHHVWSHQHAAQGGLGARGRDLMEATVLGAGEGEGGNPHERALVLWLRSGHEVRQEARPHVQEVIAAMAALGGVAREQRDAEGAAADAAGAGADVAAEAGGEWGGGYGGWGGDEAGGAAGSPMSRDARRQALEEHSRGSRTVRGATPAERRMMETVSEEGIREVSDAEGGDDERRGRRGGGGSSGGGRKGGKGAAATAGAAAEPPTQEAEAFRDVWRAEEESPGEGLATPPRAGAEGEAQWGGEEEEGEEERPGTRGQTRRSDFGSSARTAYAPDEVSLSRAGWDETERTEGGIEGAPGQEVKEEGGAEEQAAGGAESEEEAEAFGYRHEVRERERAQRDEEYHQALEAVEGIRRESEGGAMGPVSRESGAAPVSEEGKEGGGEVSKEAEEEEEKDKADEGAEEGEEEEDSGEGAAATAEDGSDASPPPGLERKLSSLGRPPSVDQPDFDALFSELADEEQKQKREEQRRLQDYKQLERDRAAQAAKREAEEQARQREEAKEVEVKVRVDEETANRSAIYIQKGVRGMLARRFVERMKEDRARAKDSAGGIVLIQAVVRGWMARKRTERRRVQVEAEELESYAAVTMQRMARGFVARRTAQRRRASHAAVRIQCAWRGHWGRVRAARAHAAAEEEALRAYAAVKVQATWRMYAVMKEHVERRIRQLAATEVQRLYRGHLGRRKAARRREWLGTEHGPQRLALGMRMIQESKEAFERHKHEIQALHREQEGLEAQATEEHASLRDAESELQTLDAALQEMNTLDEDLQGLAREKERLEREARGQQVEVVALGVDGEPSSRGEQRTMSVEERKARESEAHELEVALHVKRNERERKRRELEGRFKSVFSDVESRREALRRVEDGVQDMEATRQRKEREFQRLQRNLMELLEEQKAELDSLRAKGVELEQATSQSAAAAAATANAVKEHEDRSSQLFSGTEELLKFQFMSMSLSYFSSLNMLKNLRGMNSDTAQAAMSATASSAAAASAASGAANIPSLEGVSLGGADDLASAARKRERERAQRARSAQEAKEDAQVPFPENVREWTPDDVARWLRGISLGQYAEAFLEGAVDGDFLLELRPEDLRDVLGVEHELHIKKILFARDKLRPLSEQEQMQRRNISHELRTGGGGGGGGSPARSQRGGGASASSAAVPEVDDVIAQCRNGRRAKVEEALDSGLPVDSTDEHGNTLLLIAAQQLNRPILEMLLERGANINHQNHQGNSSLHYAMVYDPDGDMGEFLISRGADDTLENRFGLSPYDGITAE